MKTLYLFIFFAITKILNKYFFKRPPGIGLKFGYEYFFKKSPTVRLSSRQYLLRYFLLLLAIILLYLRFDTLITVINIYIS